MRITYIFESVMLTALVLNEIDFKLYLNIQYAYDIQHTCLTLFKLLKRESEL